MTLDDAFKSVFGALLTGLLAAVAWLTSKVLTNREESVKQKEQIADLEEKASKQLTPEDVRQVIESALAKRDKAAEERRSHWDRLLTLQIRESVMTGIRECQSMTKQELELMVPRIVREAIAQSSEKQGGPQ